MCVARLFGHCQIDVYACHDVRGNSLDISFVKQVRIYHGPATGKRRFRTLFRNLPASVQWENPQSAIHSEVFHTLLAKCCLLVDC